MTEYIHVPFAVGLLVAVGWTTLFSFSIRPGIRGYRNLGILASYLLLPVFLIVAGWKAALVTWAVFGVAGGSIYICWEMLQRLLTPSGDEKPRVTLAPLLHGFFAWPIMIPEAIEYMLMELGILQAPSPAELQRTAEPETPAEPHQPVR